MIGHEEGVEFAAFERLREAFEVREVEIGIRDSAKRRYGWWPAA